MTHCKFQSLLSVSEKTEKVVWEKLKQKLQFYINDINFNFVNKNGRFTEWISGRLHHICYGDDIENIGHAKKKMQV